MNDNSGRQMLLVTFFVAVAIVTFTEVHDNKRVPKPSRYVGAGLVYGILGVLAPFISYPLAAAFGVGMVVALMYQRYAGNISESPGLGDKQKGSTPSV